ncbi:uncharacterized protein [Notamacropus eugenii]|uniref:uncharacterized protein n=1 Tax=Notamacropus eugenii TaxID=9315 RepID=UPI003B681A0B
MPERAAFAHTSSRGPSAESWLASLKVASIAGAVCSMSFTLFPTDLVPFEDLFSKPPNPMLGPSFTKDHHVSPKEGCGKLSCSQSGLGLALYAPLSGSSSSPTSFGNVVREPSSPCQASEPSPDGPGAAETSGDSPCCDFGDLFCKPPNPMLSPSIALPGSGSVTCAPLLQVMTPSLLSPRPTPGSRPGTLNPDSAACRPRPGEGGSKKHSGQGGGLRPDGKKRGKEPGTLAAKGKQPQEEDFAQLLEQYRREREASEAAPVPPLMEGRTKKGAKRSSGARNASRAKKRKRVGLAKAQGPRHPAGPSTAPEHAPVSEEFIQKNTVVLGSQRVCKYFLAGRCVRGEQCRLDHAADGLKFQQLCKFYVQGYCTRGDQCRFLHHEFPCKFFHTGAKCYQGDHCVFSHAPLTPETEGLLRAALAGPAPAEVTPAAPS